MSKNFTREELDQPVLSTISDIGINQEKADEELLASASQPKEEIKLVDDEDGKAPSPAKKGVVDEESRVPYSRFETVLRRATEFEEKAKRTDELESRLKVLEQQTRPASPEEVVLPAAWKNLYGDDQNSKEAWKLQQQLWKEETERSRTEIIEGLRNQERAEIAEIQEIEQSIDEGLENIELKSGRTLTDDDKIAILGIVEEYSPQDENGSIIAPISLDKALEVFDAQKVAQAAPGRQARQKLASITSASSEGEPSSRSESNEPPRWGNYQKRWGN